MRMGTVAGVVLLGVLAASLGAGAAQAQEDETVAKWKGAPEFSEGDMTFKVRGRILIDTVWEQVDAQPNATVADFDAFNIRGRQIFLGVEGQLNALFAYKMEGGWQDGQAPQWDDVVIEYKPTDHTSLIVGNLKVASLENLTSTRFTSFMDRGPYADILDFGYLLGAAFKANGLNWTASFGITGDSLNAQDITSPSVGKQDDNEAIAITGRVSYAPVLTAVDKVHLGAWVRYRNSDSEVFTYQARPNTNYGQRFISTGQYGDKDATEAIELAWVHGPFSAQGEFAWIQVQGVDTPVLVTRNASLQTGYAFVSWFPTGEMRQYDPKRGEFVRQTVLNPVTAGGTGAVELLVRFDYADLDAARIGPPPGPGALIATAGKYKAITGGVNYYPFPYVRLMANYTSAQNIFPTPDSNIDVDVFQTRVQLDF